MVSWDKRREVQYFDFSVYLVATCVLFYLLGRHALLVGNRLQPTDVGRGQCAKASLAWIKGLCGKQPTAARGKFGRRPDRSGAKLHLKLIFFGTFGCMLWFLVYFINVLLLYVSDAFFGWLPFSHCQFAITIGANALLFARLCMYTVFVSRLFLGFDGSIYGYKKRTIYAIYVLIAVYGLCMCPLFVAFIRGNRTEYHSNGSKRHYCDTQASFYFFAFAVLGDMFFNILVMVLFIRALRQMFADTKEIFDEKKRAEDRVENADLYLLPLKYTILTSVAVVSSIASLPLYGLTGAVSLLPLDCVVNCTALLFMTGRWKPVYRVVCAPLLRCVAKSSCLPSDFIQKDLVETAAKPKLKVAVTSGSSAETSSQQSSKQSTQKSSQVSL